MINPTRITPMASAANPKNLISRMLSLEDSFSKTRLSSSPQCCVLTHCIPWQRFLLPCDTFHRGREYSFCKYVNLYSYGAGYRDGRNTPCNWGRGDRFLTKPAHGYSFAIEHPCHPSVLMTHHAVFVGLGINNAGKRSC